MPPISLQSLTISSQIRKSDWSKDVNSFFGYNTQTVTHISSASYSATCCFSFAGTCIANTPHHLSLLTRIYSRYQLHVPGNMAGVIRETQRNNRASEEIGSPGCLGLHHETLLMNCLPTKTLTNEENR